MYKNQDALNRRAAGRDSASQAWRGGLTRGLAVLFGTLWLSACAVGPNYKEPKTPVAEKFESGALSTYSQDESLTRFWEQFSDDTLNTLVNDALAANHDLRIALSRFYEARAARGLSRFDLAPTVTASAGYTDSKAAPAQSGFPTSETLKYYNAGFDAVWELDFFGRIRRNIEASSAELRASEAGLHDAQITVIAEVARTYFELRGQQTQLDVARRNVENQRESLNLTTARLNAGRGTELDTSQAQAQLSRTLGTIAPLEAAVSRSIHRLSVLTGREPTALTSSLSTARDLPPLPNVVAVGNPADLLRRRPDIRASERTLAADTARIGIAVADLFPRVTFTGSVGYAASGSPSRLGDGGTSTRLIAPGISWAAFNLGRVHEQIVAARAHADGSLALYQQTVLRALEETEDALVTHAKSREQLGHAADSAAASATAARLARARYDGGISDFLTVLDTERTQLEAEDALAQSRTDTATSLIAVYKALGGGWQEAPLPREVPIAAASTGSR